MSDELVDVNTLEPGCVVKWPETTRSFRIAEKNEHGHIRVYDAVTNADHDYGDYVFHDMMVRVIDYPAPITDDEVSSAKERLKSLTE